MTPSQLQGAFKQQVQAQMPAEPKTTQQSQVRQNPNNESPQPQQTSPEEMAQAKKNVANSLLKVALEHLTDKDADLQKYAAQISNQIDLLHQQGISLDAKQWIQMAKALAERAIAEEISAERVAKVIEPVLAGIPGKYRAMLKMIAPEAATNQLFQLFEVEANKPVKKLVTKVLESIKNG
jgi:hypothetical protein